MSGIANHYRLAGRHAFERAIEQNDENVAGALAEREPLESLLDLGCDDGARTMLWARATGAPAIHGVEVVPSRATLARERGVSVATTDLGGRFPFEDGTFDAVVSNQVIEHLFDTDLFLAEAFRVLRAGGVVVTSTENLASWHNVGLKCFRSQLMLGSSKSQPMNSQSSASPTKCRSNLPEPQPKSSTRLPPENQSEP
jgi:SAM-dependent methyltransferase